jgi:hypothetical protein
LGKASSPELKKSVVKTKIKSWASKCVLILSYGKEGKKKERVVLILWWRKERKESNISKVRKEMSSSSGGGIKGKKQSAHVDRQKKKREINMAPLPVHTQGKEKKKNSVVKKEIKMFD